MECESVTTTPTDHVFVIGSVRVRISSFPSHSAPSCAGRTISAGGPSFRTFAGGLFFRTFRVGVHFQGRLEALVAENSPEWFHLHEAESVEALARPDNLATNHRDPIRPVPERGLQPMSPEKRLQGVGVGPIGRQTAGRKDEAATHYRQANQANDADASAPAARELLAATGTPVAP